MVDTPKKPAAAMALPEEADPLKKVGQFAGDIASRWWKDMSESDFAQSLRQQGAERAAASAAEDAAVAEAGGQRDQAYSELLAASSSALGGRRNAVLLPAGSIGGEPLEVGQRSTTRARPAAPRSEFERLYAQHEAYGDLLSAETMVRAQNLGVEAEYLNNVTQNISGEVAPYIQQANEILDSAQRQFTGIQEMMDDVLANRINPGQFFANLGQAGGFASAMAVAAGTLASHMGGGPNVALGIIDGAIQRNMRAQALNQAHDRAMLQANIQIFDRMRQMGMDRMNMANVYQAMLTAQAELGLRSLQAASASAELRANAQTVLAELAVKRQQLMIDSYGSIQSTTQIKLYDQQQKMEGANQEALQKLQSTVQSVMQSPEFQGADQATREAILQRTVQQAGLPPNSPIAQQIAAMATATGTPMAPGELRQATEDDITIDQPDGSKLTYAMTPTFRALTDTGKDKVVKQLQGATRLVSSWAEFADLVQSGKLAGFRGRLSKAITRDEGGGWRATGEDPDAARIAQLMTQIVYDHMLATRGTTEAMQSPNEFYSVHAPAAGIPTDIDQWAAMATGGGLQNFAASGLRGSLRTVQSSVSPYTYDAPDPSRFEGVFQSYRETTR